MHFHKKINLMQVISTSFLDPTVLISDTTAQEALIPYPTEIGLMSRFGQLVQKAVGSLGGKDQIPSSKMWTSHRPAEPLGL